MHVLFVKHGAAENCAVLQGWKVPLVFFRAYSLVFNGHFRVPMQDESSSSSDSDDDDTGDLPPSFSLNTTTSRGRPRLPKTRSRSVTDSRTAPLTAARTSPIVLPRPPLPRTPSKSKSISKSAASHASASASVASLSRSSHSHSVRHNLSRHQAKLSSSQLTRRVQAPFSEPHTPPKRLPSELPLPLPLPLPRNANNKPRSGSVASNNSNSEPISLPASPKRGPRKSKTLLPQAALTRTHSQTQVPSTSMIPTRNRLQFPRRRRQTRVRKYATMTPQIAQRVQQSIRENKLRQSSLETRPRMHSDLSREPVGVGAPVSQTPQPLGRQRAFSSTRMLPTQGAHARAYNPYRVKYPTISGGRAGGTSPAIFATTAWPYRYGNRKRPPPPPLPSKLAKSNESKVPGKNVQSLRTPPVSQPATPTNTPAHTNADSGAHPSAPLDDHVSNNVNSNGRTLNMELAKHHKLSSMDSDLSTSRTLTSLKKVNLPRNSKNKKRASLSSIFQPLASFDEHQAAETLCQLQGPEHIYTEETHVTNAGKDASKSLLPLTEAVLASHNAKIMSHSKAIRRSHTQLPPGHGPVMSPAAAPSTASAPGVLFEGWLQVRERTNEGSISR